jgi:hypothetical protein
MDDIEGDPGAAGQPLLSPDDRHRLNQESAALDHEELELGVQQSPFVIA